jgi:dTDP-4-dehydrorhamnose reductase
MKYAVIGDKGMFGAEMVQLLLERDLEVNGFNRSNLDLDVFTAEELAPQLEGFQVIINAVAYTAVDKAETESFAANSANGIIAGKLAQAAALLGARFMHISTDYVFDGQGAAPYLVSDPVNPKSEYGRSKALGEQLVAESGANYTIFRTAWLYGAFGRCFPKVIAGVIEKNGSARVVGDQFGQPTWTRDLAEQVLAYSLVENPPNIVHAVASGKASWSDFATEVANGLGLSGEDVVTSIATSEYPTPAKRPAWSVLDNSSDLVEPIGDWRERWLVAADEVLGSR